jgi:hypothetical protein
VEELGFSFPLLKPLYPRFLPLEGLLLCMPFIQLLFDQSFLLFKFLYEALILDLDLKDTHLIIQMSLGFKYISKGLFVPKLEEFLKVF